ncbi:hypothetical protein N7508_002150 [Penicillium antarcticum]|uniref:uncharacterized protein n=1 Tax=Penicillium antarcticum TaxID=416450 RepID=UPI0023A6BEBD|nr:uncharacterized protein N7508_002150 [Penicillium antarcticum]KAJ5317642.1 hypothetical protein N7508_002150 [Penicillium antarcticum]
MDVHIIKKSTLGVISMGTPELDLRSHGLQSYLTSMKGSDQESSDTYQEAHWLVDTLQYTGSGEKHIYH